MQGEWKKVILSNTISVQQAEPNPSQVGVVSGVMLLLLAVMFLQAEELPLITPRDVWYVFPNTLQFLAKGSPGW